MMAELFSVNKVFFTVFNYPMSYIEFFGTVLYLLSVWLIAVKNMYTWPVGIISVILYFLLFFQIQLYADAMEQVYYLGASVYGWWFWARNRKAGAEDEQPVAYSGKREVIIWVSATAAASLVFGYFVSKVHLLFPAVFKVPASFPYIDAATTIMSFTAMFLMARRKTESWWYWIIVDIAGIALYFVKGVRFVALLYVILLAMASFGLYRWSVKFKVANNARGGEL
jgi:nicotinamide mononucleotide transporter